MYGKICSDSINFTVPTYSSSQVNLLIFANFIIMWGYQSREEELLQNRACSRGEIPQTAGVTHPI